MSVLPSLFHHHSLAVAHTIALSLTLGAAGSAHAANGKPAVDRNTIVVALGSAPANFDPQISTSLDSAKYAWNVYDTLYGFDLNGNLEPRLATAHKVSADGLTHTFTLRRGVKFHNGAAFTAQDAKYSLERILNPDTKSTRRPFFVNVVAGVDAPDDQTVVFRLSKKDGGFLNKVAGYLYIVPKAYTEGLKSPEAFAGAPIGTGPYKVVANRVGQSIELARFDGFWGPKPGVEKILYRVIPEASGRVNAALAGEVDIAADVQPADAERIKAAKGLELLSVPSGSPQHIRIYSNDPATPFSKQGVRLALNYAVDKAAIIQNVYRGLAAPLASTIPASYPYGANPALKPFEFDPAKAKKALADAGYANGFETQLNCASTFQREVCEAVAAYWGAIGIRTTVRVLDPVAFSQLNNTHKSGPLVISEFGNALYDPIHVINGSASKDGTWSDYFNPEVQKLIDQVEGESERSKRDAIFKEILRITRDDGQAVYLAELTLNYAKDPAVQWKPQVAGWPLNFRAVSWKAQP